VIAWGGTMREVKFSDVILANFVKLFILICVLFRRGR
jgi:hypothetical protein